MGVINNNIPTSEDELINEDSFAVKEVILIFPFFFFFYFISKIFAAM